MRRSKDAQNSRRTVRDIPGRPFKKGQLGNPGGRPKLPSESKAALRAMLPESLEALRNAINGKDLDTAVRAVNIVFNHLYGMLRQTVEPYGTVA